MGTVAVESLPWKHCRGIIALESLMWNRCCGIIAVASLLLNHDCGIMAVESLLWTAWGTFLEGLQCVEAFLRKHLEALEARSGGVWRQQEAAGGGWRQLGALGSLCTRKG